MGCENSFDNSNVTNNTSTNSNQIEAKIEKTIEIKSFLQNPENSYSGRFKIGILRKVKNEFGEIDFELKSYYNLYSIKFSQDLTKVILSKYVPNDPWDSGFPESNYSVSITEDNLSLKGTNSIYDLKCVPKEYGLLCISKNTKDVKTNTRFNHFGIIIVSEKFYSKKSPEFITKLINKDRNLILEQLK